MTTTALMLNLRTQWVKTAHSFRLDAMLTAPSNGPVTHVYGKKTAMTARNTTEKILPVQTIQSKRLRKTMHVRCIWNVP